MGLFLQNTNFTSEFTRTRTKWGGWGCFCTPVRTGRRWWCAATTSSKFTLWKWWVDANGSGGVKVEVEGSNQLDLILRNMCLRGKRKLEITIRASGATGSCPCLITCGLFSGHFPVHCRKCRQGAFLLDEDLKRVLSVGVVPVPVYVPCFRARLQQPNAEQSRPAPQRPWRSGRVLPCHHVLGPGARFGFQVRCEPLKSAVDSFLLTTIKHFFFFFFYSTWIKFYFVAKIWAKTRKKGRRAWCREPGDPLAEVLTNVCVEA